MESLLVLVIVVGLAAGIWWFSRPRRRAPRTASELRAELVRLTHDRQIAENLIAAERERSPGVGDAALIARVIRRLRHERRR